MRIVAVGECTVDRYAALSVERVGGISLNFAVNAKREGAEEVALVSCTGTDAAASAVRRKLGAERIDATQVHARVGATASQAITIGAGGERVFPPGGYDPGVLADFHLNEADRALLCGADAVAVPVFRELAHLKDEVVHAPGRTGLLVADLLDGADLGPELAGIEPLVDEFDLIFVSGDASLAERLLPRARASRSVIVVTHGAAGSSALVKGERITAAAEPVPFAECVDSTGCGDAFQAAFTVRYLRDRDLRAALRAGAHRAAMVIRHVGATSEAPTSRPLVAVAPTTR